MSDKKTEILYYTKYRDKNGTVHHTVCKYKHSDRSVALLKDLKFNCR